MNYVSVKNVFKSFGDQLVLDNVSLNIQKGERFGLIGPNGAGKTTLIDLIIGLTPRDSGEIKIKGLSVPQDNQKIRQHLGLVPQEIALIEDMSAKANLIYFGGLYGLKGRQIKQRSQEILEVVGLDQVGNKAVRNFSGGMKRRLNIAVAVIHQPEFLILDEPTVGVDAQSRYKIMEYIKYMNEEEGTTVLYTSHYMEEIEVLCDRLFILDQGRQVAYGSQDEIKMLVQDQVKWRLSLTSVPLDLSDRLPTQVKGIHRVIQEANDLHLIVDPALFNPHQLFQWVLAEGLEMTTLVKEDLSLEETFLQLTGKSLRD